jgi:hypothetical protein
MPCVCCAVGGRACEGIRVIGRVQRSEGSSASAHVRGLGLGEDFGGSESHCCDVVGGCLGAMGGMAAWCWKAVSAELRQALLTLKRKRQGELPTE